MLYLLKMVKYYENLYIAIKMNMYNEENMHLSIKILYILLLNNNRNYTFLLF